jgi:hypothetical protein
MQQAMTMRQLSAASQEPAEAAETVEAEPDRAEEPWSAAGGTQEGSR